MTTKWNRENPEKANAHSAAWRKKNPEKCKAHSAAWHEKERARLAALAGRPRAAHCDICNTQGSTVFDHDHATGLFRGWLCQTCNKILGFARDNAARLRQLAHYLETKNVR